MNDYQLELGVIGAEAQAEAETEAAMNAIAATHAEKRMALMFEAVTVTDQIAPGIWQHLADTGPMKFSTFMEALAHQVGALTGRADQGLTFAVFGQLLAHPMGVNLTGDMVTATMLLLEEDQ
jgi:hypothetical protein